MDGFAQHLRDAIAVNGERRGVYAGLTEGRSRRLSNLLIASERLLLPAAILLDARAKRWNRRGVGVVAADFVPMEGLPPAEQPPRYTGCAPKEAADKLRRELQELGKAVRGGAREAAYEEVQRHCRRFLAELEEEQERLGAHFAMVAHLVESVGFAAMNAPRWSEESAGETLGLSRQLILLQSLSLVPGVSFDVMAQELHREGCGILFNDVPAIPFPG